MIQNVPSIYNQPSVYNGGGGGLPGDFGNGAGVVPTGPTGYRQVAGVYIREGVVVNAYKGYSLLDTFGISKTDFTGVRLEGKFFAPETPVWDQNISLFDLRNFGNPAAPIYAVVLFVQNDARLQGSNGSGWNGQVSTGKNITGVFSASVFETKTIVDDFVYTNIYNTPISQPYSRIWPFVGRTSAYTTHSNNVAALGTKLYNADGDLMLHFVPVIRNSDSMPGLYEIVHDVFCDNGYCNVIEKIEE